MLKTILIAINAKVRPNKNKSTRNQPWQKMLLTKIMLPMNKNMPVLATDQTNKPNERKTSVAFVKKMNTMLDGAPAAVIIGLILITGNLPEQQVIALVTNHMNSKTAANMIVIALIPKVSLVINMTIKIGIVNMLLETARIRIIILMIVVNLQAVINTFKGILMMVMSHLPILMNVKTSINHHHHQNSIVKEPPVQQHQPN